MDCGDLTSVALCVTELGYVGPEQLALSRKGLEESRDKLVAIYV